MLHQSARFSFLKISVLGNPGRGLTRGSVGRHCARVTCPFKKTAYSPVDHCPLGKFTPVTCLAAAGFCVDSSFGRHWINELRMEILHSVNTARQPLMPAFMATCLSEAGKVDILISAMSRRREPHPLISAILWLIENWSWIRETVN